MLEKIELSTIIPATPDQVYQAWLDGKIHSAFTGSLATGEAKTNAKFTAGDGYIWGENLELIPSQRIVQSWRTTDFPPQSLNSRLEINLKATSEGTKITITHSDIPEGQSQDYYQGWIDYYFEPLQAYFSSPGEQIT